MKIIINYLTIVTILSVFVVNTYGQIVLDGDSTDWDNYPVLAEAPNNHDSLMFPHEAMAAVTDIIDIKKVKATIIDNRLYVYLELWDGPAWPNNAYENEHEGEIYYRSRGYYRLLLDLDNDASTGWSTDWYEAHYTPLGYYISQGDTYLKPIGVEAMIEWGVQMKDSWQIVNEGVEPIKYLEYRGGDYEDFDGKIVGGGVKIDYLYQLEIPEADSAKVMRWEGELKIKNSDIDELNNDSLNTYFAGHAWGHSFIEFGIELTLIQKYFNYKDGRDVLQPGDIIGICGMTESPIDQWGVDMTTKGEISVVVGVSDDESEMVESFSMDQNYPNPFNPNTTINYSIPSQSHIELKVYDVLGREVVELINGEQSSGNYEVIFDASSLTSGMYFYKITTPGYSKTMKMMLVK